MRMMDKSEIHNDEAYLAEDIVGGIEIGCDASVNPMALVFGLSLKANSLECGSAYMVLLKK